LHAVVGNGKRGKNKEIQYWKCQACEKKFTSRWHTPLYRLKTNPTTVILVLLLMANGCDLSVVIRCTPVHLSYMGDNSKRVGKGRFCPADVNAD
jgi:transposase-like protein